MLISAEVLTLLILNSIILFFSLIVVFISVKVSLKWDFNATTPKQYDLEKKAFLVATIIKYILILKIALLLFFVFTLDKISNVITGAMCAAGVVDATPYGIYLLIFKLINLYLCGFWLLIHNRDIKTKNLKFTKLKFNFFIVIFILLFIEIVVEFLMFSGIEVDKLVSCCGTLYSSSQGSYISAFFALNNSITLVFFYGSFLLLILFYFLKNSNLYAISNLVFLVVSLITLITFFGTYIYEIPTHHCPFCFLQKEYNYIGYLIYILLFGSTFYGFTPYLYDLLIKEEQVLKRSFDFAIVLAFSYVVTVSYFVVAYYLKHGVFL